MTTITLNLSAHTAVVKFSDASCNKDRVTGLSAEEAERRAIGDYESLIDSVVEVMWVHDSEGNDYRSIDGNWMTVKVLKDCPGNVLSGDQEIIDPRYDVEVIDGKGIIPNGGGYWIFGRSYDLKN